MNRVHFYPLKSQGKTIHYYSRMDEIGKLLPTCGEVTSYFDMSIYENVRAEEKQVKMLGTEYLPARRQGTQLPELSLTGCIGCRLQSNDLDRGI
jgi:hypothetical protein